MNYGNQLLQKLNKTQRRWYNVDEDFFNNIVLPYKKEPTEDMFCRDTDVFKRISLKIAHCKRELDDHKKNKIFQNEESHIYTREAYIELYDSIQRALISDFNSDEAEVEETKKELKKVAYSEVDKKLREKPVSSADPNDIGIKVDEFFAEEKYGLDVMMNKSWNTLALKEVEKDYKEYKTKQNASGKKVLSFEDWIGNKIKIKERKKPSSIFKNETFRALRKRLADDEYDDKVKDKKIAGLSTAGRFFQKTLMEYMIAIRVEVKEYSVANDVFERLNSRGTSLLKSSLIKNYIISLYPVADRKQKGKDWDEIVSNTKKNDKFLLESLLSRGVVDISGEREFLKYKISSVGKSIPGDLNHIYDIVQYQYPSNGSESEKKELADSYLTILKKDVANAKILDNPITELPDITSSHGRTVPAGESVKDTLVYLERSGAEFIRYPILTAMRKWSTATQKAYETDEFELLVKFLIPFFFRYKTVQNENVAVLKKWMLKTCEYIEKETNKATCYETIIKVLSQFVNDKTFEDKLRSDFSEPDTEGGGTTVKFIFDHITKFLGNDDSESEPRKNLELEHILPQSPAEWDESVFMKKLKDYDWDDEAGPLYEQKEFFEDLKPKFDNFIGKLGNMTLISSPKNKKLSNKKFLEKRDDPRDGYKISSLKINEKTVAEIEGTGKERLEWDAVSLLKREQYLIDLILQLWRLPKLCCMKNDCAMFEKAVPTLKNPDYFEEDGNPEWDTSKLTCDKCDSKLTIRWPKDVAGAYKAPPAYPSYT